MDDREFVAETIRESSAVIFSALAEVDHILKLAQEITLALKAGNKLVTFGNGGSAADAQHIAAELVGSFYDRSRPGLPALCLNTNVSNLTAIANDFGYTRLFERQVEAFVKPGDVVLGLSTSGNSPNVVLALELAKRQGARTAAITGKNPATIDRAAALVIKIGSNDTPRIQEATILIGHIVCALVESQFKS